MTNVGDWIGESSTTVGAGNLTLGGPLAGYTSFSSTTSGEVWYTIADGDNREAGIGTFSGITFTRATIHATIVNGVYDELTPGPINLSGNSQIFCTFSADAYEELRDHTHDGIYEPANVNIQNHISDTGIHLTSDERAALNASPNAPNAGNYIATAADLTDFVTGLEVIYHATAAEALAASQIDSGAGLHVAPEGT